MIESSIICRSSTSVERRLEPIEPRPACLCKYCRDYVFEGEELVVTLDGENYHLDCFQDVAAQWLLSHGDAVIETATAAGRRVVA